MMENAVAHGYRMATEKGYAEKRARQRGQPRHERPAEDWVAGLMALSGARGAGTVAPAPGDSPVAGLTTETFRAQVAAMRAAEYERARGRKGETH